MVRFQEILILGFFPLYLICVILKDFLTILGNSDFGIFPFYVIFVILSDFLTILGNFDFGIFPILCDFCHFG